MLYGITDIGSNTVRLNVYRYDDNDINIVFSKKENLGLMFYVDEGRLTEEGIEKIVKVVKELKNDLDDLHISGYSFFSTAALRNIKNSSDVIQTIKNRVNVEIELLSGEEEGQLSFCGSIFNTEKDDGVLIDLGGGSVEIVLFKDRNILENYSIPVGSLKMFNEYVSEMLPNKEESDLIRERVCFELKKIGADNNEKIPFMYGIGGSIRAIGKILVDLKLLPNKNDLIDIALLEQLKNELGQNNKDTYNKILHVKPSRIHTVVPALIIIETITSYFGCEEIQISKFGVREGYLYEKVLKRCLNV